MCVEVNKEGLSGIGLDLNASPLLFNLQNSDKVETPMTDNLSISA